MRDRTDFPAGRSHNGCNGEGYLLPGMRGNSLQVINSPYAAFRRGHRDEPVLCREKRDRHRWCSSRKEIEMNWDRIEDNWKQAKEKNENEISHEDIHRIEKNQEV